MTEQKNTLEIGSGTIIRVLFWVLLLLFLYLIRNVLVIVIFSVVIASGIEPAAQWFAKRRIPRVVGVLITYIVAIVFLSVTFSLIVPSLFSEFSALASDLPSFIHNAIGSSVLTEYFPNLPASLEKALSQFSNNIAGGVAEFPGDFFGTVSALFGSALSFLMVIVLSFYLSVQERGIENFLRIVVPLNYEEYVVNLWKRSRRKIGRWFQGQILLGLLVGVIVFLGLTILQVRFALSLAVLAGIFELIPIFGPTLSAIPAVIIAFFQEPFLGVLTILLYIVVQQIENNLVYPVVMRKAIGVHPALVILSIIIGGQLGGVLGILLAVPIVVVLVEISNDIAAQKHIT